LAGTRYDWLRHPARMELKDRKEFTEPRNSELKKARAWALKETAMALYEYVYGVKNLIVEAQIRVAKPLAPRKPFVELRRTSTSLCRAVDQAKTGKE